MIKIGKIKDKEFKDRVRTIADLHARESSYTYAAKLMLTNETKLEGDNMVIPVSVYAIILDDLKKADELYDAATDALVDLIYH